VQDEIAGLVAQQLQLRLADTRGRDPLLDAEVHQLYLEGKYFLNQFSRESAKRASVLFQQVVEKAPSFALGWVALSNAGTTIGGYGETRGEFEGGYALARRAAEKALALDPDLAAARVALADVQRDHDFDWKSAAESLRRAREREPENIEVLRSSLRLAKALGQIEDAVVLGERVVALDPVNPAARLDFGHCLMLAGHYPAALAQIRRLAELNPGAQWSHAGVSLIFSAQGSFDAAADEAAREIHEWSRLFALAIAEHGRKNTKAAAETLGRLIETHGDIAAYQIAEVYGFRHEPDQAFEWLERAFRQRDPGLANLKMDIFLRKIHDDPRWQPFLRKLGLADDQLPSV